MLVSMLHATALDIKSCMDCYRGGAILSMRATQHATLLSGQLFRNGPGLQHELQDGPWRNKLHTSQRF